MQAKALGDLKDVAAQRQMMHENGEAVTAFDEAGIRKGEYPYNKYFGQPDDHQFASEIQA